MSLIYQSGKEFVNDFKEQRDNGIINIYSSVKVRQQWAPDFPR